MLTALVGLLLLPPADVEPRVEAPKGQPPTIATVQVEKDALVSNQTITQQRPETRTITENVGGKNVTRTITVLVPVTVISKQAWSLKGAKAQQADGTKIEIDALKKRLATPRPVVIATDGQPIDPAYLRLLQKNTIVVIVPRMAPGAIGVVPAPPIKAPPPPKP